MDISSELIKAEQLIHSGKLEEAKAVIRLVLSADKRNADAWYLASQCMPEPKAKAEALRRVLLIDPDHPRAKREFNAMNGNDILRPPSLAQTPVPQVTKPKPQTRPSRRLLAAGGGIGAVLLLVLIAGIVVLSRGGGSPDGAARSFIHAVLTNDDSTAINTLTNDSKAQTLAFCSPPISACLSKSFNMPTGTQDVGSTLINQTGPAAMVQVELRFASNSNDLCLNIAMQNQGGWKVVDSVGSVRPCNVQLADPSPVAANVQPMLIPTTNAISNASGNVAIPSYNGTNTNADIATSVAQITGTYIAVATTLHGAFLTQDAVGQAYEMSATVMVARITATAAAKKP